MLKYGELDNDIRIFVCLHVAKRNAAVKVLGTDPDGDYFASCGCTIDEATIVCFGDLKEMVPELLSYDVALPGMQYWRPSIVIPWTLEKGHYHDY